MFIEIDFNSDQAIYMQLRDQIIPFVTEIHISYKLSRKGACALARMKYFHT